MTINEQPRSNPHVVLKVYLPMKLGIARQVYNMVACGNDAWVLQSKSFPEPSEKFIKNSVNSRSLQKQKIIVNIEN